MNVTRLVKKAKKGNKEALLQLIMEQKDDYYKLAYTYMGNQYDAMDAIEEMTVIVFEKINQLKKEERFYSWSKTILVNSCRSLLRRRKKVVLVEDWQQYTEEQVANTPSLNPYQSTDEHLDILQLLQHVNEDQAEAIKLKYFLDLDYETIAQLTNVSVGTVKSRVFQGLKKLRSFYGGENGE
ncbi:RNA polymerase sigma factor [Alkalihalobacterium bogoriense]|uniref:RNA polymerase sigma factor n=1 Tax=Alkalihalobacterium bogoriense TaxID=246272 RepID=UPI00047E6292|nr:RNA polymerase sigma factor [Alkalihalobacterium bogoriense]